MSREHRAIISAMVSANRTWNNLDQAATVLTRLRPQVAFAGTAELRLNQAIEAIHAKMDEVWNMAEDCERELEALSVQAEQREVA